MDAKEIGAAVGPREVTSSGMSISKLLWVTDPQRIIPEIRYYTS